MNTSRPTGLGEPEVSGKLSLFQPPKSLKSVNPVETQSRGEVQENKKPEPKRIHTTLDLTWDASAIDSGIAAATSPENRQGAPAVESSQPGD